MEKLTEKQEELLIHIKKFIANNGYAPSVRELCVLMDLTSTATVFVHIRKLISKGYISQKSSKFRTLELLVPNEYDKKKNHLLSIKYINTEDSIDIPYNLIDTNNKIYAYKVKDNNLNNIGIYKEDTIIYIDEDSIKDNDLVIIEEENKIKITKYNKENNKESIKLLGRVKTLYRAY